MVHVASSAPSVASEPTGGSRPGPAARRPGASRRRLLAAGGALGLSWLAPDCTGRGGPGAESPSAGAFAAGVDEESFPVIIDHVHGATRIERAPERVATVSGVNQDVVIALGVVPVGVPLVMRGADVDGAYPWTSAALDALGAPWGGDAAPMQYSEADGIDVAAIAALEPDLIIGVHSGMSADEYTALSDIAPTLAYPAGLMPYSTPWEEATRIIGHALGLARQAEELVTATRDAVEAAALEHPELAGRSFVACVLEAKRRTVSLYTETDHRAKFLAYLGMTMAQAAATAGKQAQGSFFVDFPAEQAHRLAADLLWAWVADEDGAQAVADDDLLSQLPAVAAGTALFVTDATTVMSMSEASPLSLPWTCENHVPEIADAVAATLAAAAAAASAEPEDGATGDGPAADSTDAATQAPPTPAVETGETGE